VKCGASAVERERSMRAKQRSVAEPLIKIKEMAYQQAQIAVTKTAEFEQLKSALERVFTSAVLEKFYGKLQSRSIPVREFEKILDLRLLEAVEVNLAKSATTAKELYGSLTVSDQALMREFYLERIEKVETKIRQKYQKIYQYY